MAILGQKQSGSSYMACGSNFWLSMYAFTKPADFEFSREKVLRQISLIGNLILSCYGPSSERPLKLLSGIGLSINSFYAGGFPSMLMTYRHSL